jgi:aminobenzoyl-glutamate utilization protein B
MIASKHSPATTFAVIFLLLCSSKSAIAQSGKETVLAYIDENSASYSKIAQDIWGFAELGFLEKKSSALLQSTLQKAGFEIEAGVAEMPTAFVASYGSGKPVIAFLAEYDALPGISQDRVPERRPLAGVSSGHACGHNLFGTASTAAAIAVKEWMESSGTGGTLRLYGTPAEEGGNGKVYMVHAGLFDDVDVVLHWHPDSRNATMMVSTLAVITAKFRFHGVSAHASAAPHLARSALDAVEALDYMVNMMREHVPQESRIHYVITNGGLAPNVTPDFAEANYYVRHPDAAQVKQIFERIVKAAQGAALGTETTMEYEVTGGNHALLPNEVLGRVLDANLNLVGGVEYDAAEREFASKLQATLPEDSPPPEAAAGIDPFSASSEVTPISTDVGDVSRVAPTIGLTAATFVPGTSLHTWQAVAAGGTSIGNKGMIVAAKTMALTAVDLFTNRDLIPRARAEFEKRRGPDFEYMPLLGDRPPPLDYREKP